MSQKPTHPAHYTTWGGVNHPQVKVPSGHQGTTLSGGLLTAPPQAGLVCTGWTYVHRLDVCAQALVSLNGQAHSPHPPDAWPSEEDNTALLLSGGPGV